MSYESSCAMCDTWTPLSTPSCATFLHKDTGVSSAVLSCVRFKLVIEYFKFTVGWPWLLLRLLSGG